MKAFVLYNGRDHMSEALTAEGALAILEKDLRLKLTFQPATGRIYVDGKVCGVLYQQGYNQNVMSGADLTTFFAHLLVTNPTCAASLKEACHKSRGQISFSSEVCLTRALLDANPPNHD